MSREPSLRQLEKAPEGRAPRTSVVQDEEPQLPDGEEEVAEAPHEESPPNGELGHATTDSRFTEEL